VLFEGQARQEPAGGRGVSDAMRAGSARAQAGTAEKWRSLKTLAASRGGRQIPELAAKGKAPPEVGIVRWRRSTLLSTARCRG
jgi:hypothetical protein